LCTIGLDWSLGTTVFLTNAAAMASSRGIGSSHLWEKVADLLERLNLTKDEEEIAAFSYDEEGEIGGALEFMLIGKVLSPSTLHITTITNTIRPAWGNPFGLKLQSVGERPENLFIAEFRSLLDKKRAMTAMQASLRCKRAIVPRGSLDADLTVDENLSVKPSHHYLTKLCKTSLVCLRLDPHPIVHGAYLHACI
jgi:hypothetical protein